MTIGTPEIVARNYDHGRQVRAVNLTTARLPGQPLIDFLWADRALYRLMAGWEGGDRHERGNAVLGTLEDWGCYRNDHQWARVCDVVRDAIR